MRTRDFINDLSDLLSEDFSYNAVWTKAELLSYTRQVLKQFCELTLIVDRNTIRVLDTNGEAVVPVDYADAYYGQYETRHIDIVQLGDLDFIDGSWLTGTTGTPRAMTVLSTGDSAVFRLVPVPSGGTVQWTTISTLYLTAPDTTVWHVSITGDVLSTIAEGASGRSSIPVGPSSDWLLTVDNNGILTTSANSSGTAPEIISLSEVGGSQLYSLSIDQYGVLSWEKLRGKVTEFFIDAVRQTFTSTRGTVRGAYPFGAVSSLEHTISVNKPFGTVKYAISSDSNMMVWYKGIVDDITGLESEIYLSKAFIPVLQHGVLSMAYANEGTGQDTTKAELLYNILKAECESIRRIFQRQ
jgi:hypothetical protein